MKRFVLLASISAGVLGNIALADTVIWDSKDIFSEDVPRLPAEKPFPKDKVVYPSNAGGGGHHRVSNGMLEWDGDQTRTYVDFYHIKPLVDTEIEFYAIKNEFVEDVSVKIGNHSMDDWEFGGYGCIFEANAATSKVEYYHNDQGTKVAFPLSKTIEPGQMIGYRVAKRNAPNGEVAMDCWVDYTGTGNEWVKVVDNRTWTASDWNPPNVPKGAQDSVEIKAGVYTGVVHRWWIRINGYDASKDGNIKVKSIKVKELDSVKNPKK
jgi:hypothetical protein